MKAIIFATIVVAAALGGKFGRYNQDQKWHRDLIQRGLAEYCATTGDWAFKGECE